jgi:hypothetical protein
LLWHPKVLLPLGDISPVEGTAFPLRVKCMGSIVIDGA